MSMMLTAISHIVNKGKAAKRPPSIPARHQLPAVDKSQRFKRWSIMQQSWQKTSAHSEHRKKHSSLEVNATLQWPQCAAGPGFVSIQSISSRSSCKAVRQGSRAELDAILREGTPINQRVETCNHGLTSVYKDYCEPEQMFEHVDTDPHAATPHVKGLGSGNTSSRFDRIRTDTDDSVDGIKYRSEDSGTMSDYRKLAPKKQYIRVPAREGTAANHTGSWLEARR
ncbi:hypothetical protein FB451DRAFT_1198293 [Mycena latifolia]|nr:hypothetical protein FB451DRAFT_1198293 [Mycena latifolia]